MTLARAPVAGRRGDVSLDSPFHRTTPSAPYGRVHPSSRGGDCVLQSFRRVGNMNSDLFITGTDTNVGKTLLSAVLVAALDRKYWKPIQTGAVEGTDRETVIK